MAVQRAASRKLTMALVLVLTLSVRAAALRVVKQGKPCAKGCTDRGNCNAETGGCECPWGFTGPACEVDQMAICRQTPDDPGSCGTIWPKHCECYRACYALWCHHGTHDWARCAHESGGDMRHARCFIHNDPAAPPSSLLPPDFATSTTWYEKFPEAEGRAAYTPELRAPSKLWGLSNWDVDRHLALPHTACPGACSNGRGACIRWAHEHEPKCSCHKGYNGTDCSGDASADACWFSPDCGGRGTCRAGFCHCRPGHWGVGCHRQEAYQAVAGGGEAGGGAGEAAEQVAQGPQGQAALPDARSPTRFKVYMYDLPWTVAFGWEYNDGSYGRDQMYAAYEYFMRYFLQDGAVRTENPYEANLFYVPMLLYWYIGNVRDPVPQAEFVLQYVREKWPFYNRSGGHDHFYFMTGDRGSCPLLRDMQDATIKLVHFGMQRGGLDWHDVRNKEYGCIQVKRDLVIPPLNMFKDILPVETDAYYQWLVSNGGHDGNRTLLFFFAGGVGEGNVYSGGARQAIKRLMDIVKPPPPDVLFLEGSTPDYRKLLLTSKFCIAPYGFGWGLRLIQAVEFGCIPVIIQDGVYQPFEDFLPYEDLAVRMPLAGIGHMIETLRSYSEADLARLRLGLARHHRAFVWNREWGGRAYEWTLAGLQRRAEGMQAQHFRR